VQERLGVRAIKVFPVVMMPVRVVGLAAGYPADPDGRMSSSEVLQHARERI